MKITRISICVLLCICLLCGCAREPAAAGEPTAAAAVSSEPAAAETVPAEPPAPSGEQASLPPELAAFDQVFRGTRAITRTGSGESILLSQISLFFTVEEFPWKVIQVAVPDLDSDGVLEAVLEVENYAGFVILEYQDGAVLGTEIWYRAFRDLKADGSFAGSGSSFDRNYWQYAFGGNILLAERYAAEDGSPHYSLSGTEAEEAAFYQFELKQQSKPAATWYPSWQEYLATLL